MDTWSHCHVLLNFNLDTIASVYCHLSTSMIDYNGTPYNLIINCLQFNAF